MNSAARSLSARRGNLEGMPALTELDEREIMIDGHDYYLLALWDRATGRTYIRWTRVDQDVLGPLLEVHPSRLGDVLKHPTLFAPIAPSRQIVG